MANLIEQRYETLIEAPRNIVWRALWDDKFYRRWTAIFKEGSYVKGAWEKGGEIHFLTPEGNGMYSRINALDEPNEIVFEHLGEIKDGVRTEKEEWLGNFEGYELEETAEGTRLTVSIKISPEWLGYFDETFPKALEKLKEIAEAADAFSVTIEVTAKCDIRKAWSSFTAAENLTRWNFAGDDWHCPKAENELRPGGRFNYRMETKDGNIGFDLTGSFISVDKPESLVYEFDDGRRVEVVFESTEDTTRVIQTFEVENENPVSLQRNGWQTILNNFAAFCETAT
ncbi:MAG: SRPBCC family protein [Pyrinomonadaceae bacterium]